MRIEIPAPRDFVLDCNVGEAWRSRQLLARMQRFLNSSVLRNVDFTLTNGDTRTLNTRTNGKNCTYNGNSAVLCGDIQMSIALLCRFDDHAATFEIDADAIISTG